ncbi:MULTISPECIES: hypothetical protein [unclassified Moritella]|uniref:hypothetical protein n=1 Tax=unclassified Moritella TaxID=2637987 RepID=UPI001BA5D072|nr:MULTISPECIES: hypothetical protein [unclassified Moritella]QUM82014.1 hypothetical protein HWV01_17870 [Moritella sp. 5]QUM86307.1 hypothetical protein HWV02_18250 [Moritella sp. 28]
MNDTHFLNVDLDVESKQDITPIVEFWGDEISVFRLEEVDGTWFGAFETLESAEDDIIEKYHQLITGLPSDLRTIWDSAIKRVFDFGYDGGSTPRAFQSTLSQDSVSKLADVGGRITVTIYAPEE